MNVITKARVTYVRKGYGDLTLTDSALIWKKTASSFFVFGLLNALTTNFEPIPFADIAEVSPYPAIGSGGIKIVDKQGKEYKFTFNRKKEFEFYRDYLVEKFS